MAIRFECQDCCMKIKVPEGAEGRQVKCPRCGAVHRVPAQALVATESVAESVTESVEPDRGDLASSTADDLDSLASAVDEVSAEDAVADDPFEDQDDHIDEDEPDEAFDDDDSFDPIQDQDEDEEDEDEEHNPLAQLASMAQADESPIAELDEEEPVDETVDEDLFDQEPQEVDDDQPISPQVTPAATIERPVGIPLARPKPQPAGPPPTPLVGEESSQSAASPTSSSHRPPSPQPRAIPISSQPAASRPLAKPIPLGKPADGQGGPAQTAALPSLRVLPLLGWILRVLAFLTLGGAVKLVLIASDLAWPFMDCLLVFMYSLIVTVVVWTVAELTLIISTLLADRSDGQE